MSGWSIGSDIVESMRRRVAYGDLVGRPSPDRAALLAMLKRTALGLHAISLLNADIGPKAREAARDLAAEANALIKRMEKT